MGRRTILILSAVFIGLSAQADYTVTTVEPLYPNQTYGYPPIQQPYNQLYPQQYNQTYNEECNQGYYHNPYQAGYQQQYMNPYQYQRPYVGYSNNLPFGITNNAASSLNTASVPRQIARNVGQSMLLRMLGGY